MRTEAIKFLCEKNMDPSPALVALYQNCVARTKGSETILI